MASKLRCHNHRLIITYGPHVVVSNARPYLRGIRHSAQLHVIKLFAIFLHLKGPINLLKAAVEMTANLWC